MKTRAKKVHPPAREYHCSWGCPTPYTLQLAPGYSGTRCGRCGHEAQEVLDAQRFAAAYSERNAAEVKA